METDIIIDIVFDEKTFTSQRAYNLKYCEAVNKVLEQLKTEVSDLSEQDIIDFLSCPARLAARLEEADRKEYNNYLSSLPKSVQTSMTFHSDKQEIIERLHRQLPESSSYFFTQNCCRIKDGSCLFDEDQLKAKCMVSGSPALGKIWERAQEVAASLTKLEAEVRKVHSDMHILEDGMILQMGLIRCEDGKTFAPDIDRLRQML